MTGGAPGFTPGPSDPTRNPEATRALLEDQHRKGQKSHLRPWEQKAIRWIFVLCIAAIVLYGLMEVLG